MREPAPSEQFCELDTFVRRCVHRIETELGRADAWSVTIAVDRVSYACNVTVWHGPRASCADGNSFDPAIAAWEALRATEVLLRASRAARGGDVEVADAAV